LKSHQAQERWLEISERGISEKSEVIDQFSGQPLRLPNTGSASVVAQVKPKNRFMKELLAGIFGGA